METSASVIILDSDSEDGSSTKPSSICAERKRKCSVITATPNCTAATSSLNGQLVETARQESEPVRKRIKPITVASNLPPPDGNPSPSPSHQNNNNIQVVAGANENFAKITYSEDWELEMKQYQLELNGQTRKPEIPSKATNTINDDSESADRSTPEARTVPQGTNAPTSGKPKGEKNQIGKDFERLLDACRKADPSQEMETLIQKRLIRYYEVVHPDYVNSKSFQKAVAATTADVLANPDLVFLKLASIVEELNARRKSRPVLSEPRKGSDGTCSSGGPVENTTNTRKDKQIARLNRTLYLLKKRIQQLDEADVDFNDDGKSAYVMVQRYKKRAFQVYEKLCDITGESKDAHRLVKKPIQFQETQYPEFNRTIQQFVNRTDAFPDFRDVLKCLEHCNSRYDYRMRPELMQRVAHDAFFKVGKLLQKRRKTDLYETVSYYASEESDPALVDHKLQEKLEQNRKHYNKVGDLIDKFAQVQDAPEQEFEEIPPPRPDGGTETGERKGSQNPAQSQPSSSSSHSNNSQKAISVTNATNQEASVASTSSSSPVGSADDDGVTVVEDVTDSDEEDDDEDDEDEFEGTTKENVRPDCFEDIVISDDEELLVS
ncbi:daxx-like protein [Anopheles bellator]|uniref:daxx-like protein n=1 Tax=Anopheles bellator TaxID=139047 RepID=UPI002648AF29|nr:daxx-like protein [Anopheles bellator]